MIDNNAKILTVSNTQLRRNMIFTIVAGILFAALGLQWHDNTGMIFIILGIAFIIKGALSYTRSAQYPTIKITEQPRSAS